MEAGIKLEDEMATRIKTLKEERRWAKNEGNLVFQFDPTRTLTFK